jgi:hypothetical protein
MPRPAYWIIDGLLFAGIAGASIHPKVRAGLAPWVRSHRWIHGVIIGVGGGAGTAALFDPLAGLVQGAVTALAGVAFSQLFAGPPRPAE